MVRQWGFRCSFKIHQADGDKSLQLLKNDGEKVDYSKFIKDNMGINEIDKLWLMPWLFNGTLQTLYYASSNTGESFPVYYGREIFTYSDGGICSLDHVIEEPSSKEDFQKLYDETLPKGWPKLHPRTRFLTDSELDKIRKPSNDQEKPLCFVFHGLGGGSNESLIRNFAELLTTESKSGKAWDIVVVNSRGCCRTKLTTGQLFSGLSIEDIKEVIDSYRASFPHRKFYCVGFSFGAALLANYLGSVGSNSPVTAACLIGCPWDFVDSSYHLESSFSGSRLFNPSLTNFLNKIIKNNHAELQENNPDFFTDQKFMQSKNLKRLSEFDALYTCHYLGLSNPYEYYRKASPVNSISKIKTPTLALNSTDDPAVGCRLPIMDFEANPYMCLVESDLGGHLAYVKPNGEFWSSRFAETFFNSFEDLIK